VLLVSDVRGDAPIELMGLKISKIARELCVFQDDMDGELLSWESFITSKIIVVVVE